MSDYVFAWTCPSPSRDLADWEGVVSEDLSDYNNIVDYINRKSEDVDFETFAKAVGGERKILDSLHYGSQSYEGEDGLKISDDWSVSWHKSMYPDGTPILFFAHSGIEHVFEPTKRRNSGLSFRDETSPLDYHGHHPQRLSLVDPAAPPPTDSYFAETTRKITRGATGRQLKKPKLEIVPGASPGVVAFVDYDLDPNYDLGSRSAFKGRLFVHYVAVRRDQQRKGLMRKILDELIARHVSVGYLDFGDVHHAAAWKYVQRLRPLYEKEGRQFRAKPMGSFNPPRRRNATCSCGATDAFRSPFTGRWSCANCKAGGPAVRCPGCNQAIYVGPRGGSECGGEGEGICYEAAYAFDSDSGRPAWEGDGPPPDARTRGEIVKAHGLAAKAMTAQGNPFLAKPEKFHGHPAGGTHQLPGFHTASDRDQALPYAHQKGGAMDAEANLDESCEACDGEGTCAACLQRVRIHDYPVVVAVDMSGLEAEYDVDARQVLENLMDAARDALKTKDPVEYFRGDGCVECETPDSVEVALFQSMARHEEDPASSFAGFLEDLPDDEALEAIRVIAAGGKKAAQVVMRVIGQFRYLQDVPADRIVSVDYIQPIWDEILDSQGREEDEEKAGALESAGWDVLDLDDVLGYSVHGNYKRVWERPRPPGARIEWHGTGYRNLLLAAPELADRLPKPPLPYEGASQ